MIAEDRGLESRRGSATMVFGLGPALGSSPPDYRCSRLLRALEPQVAALRWGHQVHGTRVVSLPSRTTPPPTGASCVGRCDAIVTDTAGVGLMVWTADCVPLLLAGDHVVAAVHSGWRGTASDIVGSVIRVFDSEFGVSAERIRAVLGPAISGPSYEVGSEVIDALASLGIDPRHWRTQKHVDLRNLLVVRLGQLGLESDAITVIESCTASDPRLASYRRDGISAGRQFSLIYRPADSEPTVDRLPRS